MIARQSSSKSEYKGDFLQKRNANKMTMRVGLFSSVGRISSVGLGVVAFWGELNS